MYSGGAIAEAAPVASLTLWKVLLCLSVERSEVGERGRRARRLVIRRSVAQPGWHYEEGSQPSPESRTGKQGWVGEASPRTRTGQGLCGLCHGLDEAQPKPGPIAKDADLGGRKTPDRTYHRLRPGSESNSSMRPGYKTIDMEEVLRSRIPHVRDPLSRPSGRTGQCAAR